MHHARKLRAFGLQPPRARCVLSRGRFDLQHSCSLRGLLRVLRPVSPLHCMDIRPRRSNLLLKADRVARWASELVLYIRSQGRTANTHARTRARTHARTHTRARTRTCTHERTHARTHTHTHTHTHTQPHSHARARAHTHRPSVNPLDQPYAPALGSAGTCLAPRQEHAEGGGLRSIAAEQCTPSDAVLSSV